MGFQFIHVEGYGRSAGAGKKGGRSIGDVVNEAEREPGHCPHVENPEKPQVVHGVSPKEAGRIAAERADQAKDPKGRAMRKDGLCLLAGVVSFPHTVEECKADPEKMKAYRAWEKDAVRFLQKTYGEDLASVVRHTDEQYPHLHFYATPRPDKDGRLSLESVHSGRAASAQAKAAGKPKGDQNRAYKAAMREFQNRYFQAVGIRHGQARLGPGRRRLSRDQWKAEQATVANMSKALKSARAEEIDRVKSEAKAYQEKVRREAEKAAKEAAKKVGQREAAKIINKAKKEAAAMTAGARRFGGWLQATMDSMTGRRRQLEEEAKRQVEEVRDSLEFENGQLKTIAAADAKRAKELQGQLSKVKGTLSEVSADRDRLREKVAQLSPKEAAAMSARMKM